MKKIIFVCTGNTCRSPMAEALLKHKLKNTEIKCSVTSAGLHAEVGASMSKNSIDVLKENGIKSVRFKSKQLSREMLSKASMIICMTAGHKAAIVSSGNVFTLSELTGCMDVSDPFGQDINAYRRTFKELDAAINVLIKKYLI